MTSPRYPLPWWLVLDADSIKTAPGGVYRGAVVLALAYWAGGCRDLPTDDVTLAALCRLPIAGWRLQKNAIMAALVEIQPGLIQVLHQRQKLHPQQLRKIADMNAKKAAKRLAAENGTSRPTAVLTAPRRDSPVRAANVMPSHPVAAAGTETTFTD